MGASRERGGDPKDIMSVSCNRSGDNGDIEGEEGDERTGLPIAARSTVPKRNAA